MRAPTAMAAVGAGFQAPPELELEAAEAMLLVAAAASEVTLESSLWALDLADPVAVAMMLLRLEALEAASLVTLAMSLETEDATAPDLMPLAKVEAWERMPLTRVDASERTAETADMSAG